MFEKRINIFTGHFGSGKTEVAANYAMQLARMCFDTVIVDLDIVNPYFRTADIREKFIEAHVKTIIPVFANTNVDIPALPAEISSVFENKNYAAVLDVGGDDLGARVLSRYRDEIMPENHEIFFVINTRREMTDSIEKIINIIAEIENSSRLKVTALVNNTNLLGETSIKDLLQGQSIIQEASDTLEIPISFVSTFLSENEVKKAIPDIEVFEMKKQIFLPWEK